MNALKTNGRKLYLLGLWTIKFHTLITWWRIDTQICCAHPPHDFANYLNN